MFCVVLASVPIVVLYNFVIDEELPYSFSGELTSPVCHPFIASFTAEYPVK